MNYLIVDAIDLLNDAGRTVLADAVRDLSARVADLEAQLAEAQRQEPVMCHHEAYQGRCIHCDCRIANGAPVPAQPSASSAVRALDMLSVAALDHYTPYMICVPTEKWVEAMGIAGEEMSQPSAPVAQPGPLKETNIIQGKQPAPAVADGMRLIVDAADLEVGRWYWTRWRDGGTVRMQHVFAHMDDPTKKYVGEGRLWAYPGNDQFTGYLVAVGPVPKAEFDAMLAASAPPCLQVNDGVQCMTPRAGNARLCPDCNPRAASAPKGST